MIEDEWFITGNFDVDDRPNTELIYRTYDGVEAEKVFKMMDESLTDQTPEERKQELRNTLENDFGVAWDIWDEELRFSLGELYRAQQVKDE